MVDVTLYFHPFSSPSRKVLCALYEKNVEFTEHPIALFDREQHEDWFLRLNPKGEVPVLKHGDTVIVESTKILQYIDQNFGQSNQLFLENSEKIGDFFKKLDAIPTFPLTYGAAVFHREKVTDKLRWPYTNPELEAKVKNVVINASEALKTTAETTCILEAKKALTEKALAYPKILQLFYDVDSYMDLMSQVERLLDQVEEELSSSNHLGPWLFGARYSAADIGFSIFLLRLYQIGMDGKLWKHGHRPGIAVYAEMAFKRRSFLKATNYDKHLGEEITLYSEEQKVAMNAACMGLGTALVLGAAYVYKKLKR